MTENVDEFQTWIKTADIHKMSIDAPALHLTYMHHSLQAAREFVLRIYRAKLMMDEFNWNLEELIESSKNVLNVKVVTDWDNLTLEYSEIFERTLPKESEILTIWTLLRPITGDTNDGISFASAANSVDSFLRASKLNNESYKAKAKSLKVTFKEKIEDVLGFEKERKSRVDGGKAYNIDLLRGYLYGEASHHDFDVRKGVISHHYREQFHAAAPLVLDLADLSLRLFKLIDETLPIPVADWILDYEGNAISFTTKKFVAEFGTSFDRLMAFGVYQFPTPAQTYNRLFLHPEEFSCYVDLDQPFVKFFHPENRSIEIGFEIPDKAHFSFLAGHPVVFNFTISNNLSESEKSKRARSLEEIVDNPSKGVDLEIKLHQQ